MTVKGDIAGGLTVAMLAVPVSAAMAAFSMAALGPAGAAQGLIGGIWALAIGTLVLVLLGSQSTGIVLPRSVTGLFVAALVMGSPVAGPLAGLPASEQFIGVFLFLTMAGLFQALIGWTRLADIVKFCPQPVLAGFLTAVGLQLIHSQIGTVLSMEEVHSVLDLRVQRLEDVLLLNLVVVAFTGAAMKWPIRRLHPLPPMLVALLAGTLMHHALLAMGWGAHLGHTFGELPTGGVTLVAGSFPAFISSQGWLAAELAVAAFGLALVASLDHLMSSKAYEGTTGVRLDGSRELTKLGAANAALAVVGCLPLGINLTNSLAGHAAGIRSRKALVVVALFATVTAMLLAPLISVLPKSVLAMLLIFLGWRLVDIKAMKRLLNVALGRSTLARHQTADLSVFVVVAMVALLAGVTVGVLAGAVISVGFFVVTASKTLVRRTHRADSLHSRRTRSDHEMAILRHAGKRIAVLELEGAVFFGSAESLAAQVESLLQDGATSFVLDFRRVTHIDTTGAHVIGQLAQRTRLQRASMRVGFLSSQHPAWQTLREAGAVRAVGEEHFFSDTDHALEKAEDALFKEMAERGHVELVNPARPTPGHALLGLLSADEMAQLEPHLEKRVYEASELVFREGDTLKDELFIIVEGSASIYRAIDSSAQKLRLTTFSKGAVFGEMAFLDASPRSADVRADERLVCRVMSRDEFNTLLLLQPELAGKLLLGLSKELGRRLRVNNQIISALL